jgi:hypothetical protein
MRLHHLVLWLLAVNLLFGPLVGSAAAGPAGPEAPTAGVETVNTYSQRSPRAGFLPKPGLYSSSSRCVCVLPHLQQVNWETSASSAAPGALRLAVAELAGMGPALRH